MQTDLDRSYPASPVDLIAFTEEAGALALSAIAGRARYNL